MFGQRVSCAGTFAYIAPEVLQLQQCTAAVDIFRHASKPGLSLVAVHALQPTAMTGSSCLMGK